MTEQYTAEETLSMFEDMKELNEAHRKAYNSVWLSVRYRTRLESVIDTMVESGNGGTSEDMIAATDLLFEYRDKWANRNWIQRIFDQLKELIVRSGNDNQAN